MQKGGCEAHSLTVGLGCKDGMIRIIPLGYAVSLVRAAERRMLPASSPHKKLAFPHSLTKKKCFQSYVHFLKATAEYQALTSTVTKCFFKQKTQIGSDLTELHA